MALKRFAKVVEKVKGNPPVLRLPLYIADLWFEPGEDVVLAAYYTWEKPMGGELEKVRREIFLLDRRGFRRIVPVERRPLLRFTVPEYMCEVGVDVYRASDVPEDVLVVETNEWERMEWEPKGDRYAVLSAAQRYPTEAELEGARKAVEAVGYRLVGDVRFTAIADPSERWRGFHALLLRVPRGRRVLLVPRAFGFLERVEAYVLRWDGKEWEEVEARELGDPAYWSGLILVAPEEELGERYVVALAAVIPERRVYISFPAARLPPRVGVNDLVEEVKRRVGAEECVYELVDMRCDG